MSVREDLIATQKLIENKRDFESLGAWRALEMVCGERTNRLKAARKAIIDNRPRLLTMWSVQGSVIDRLDLAIRATAP